MKGFPLNWWSGLTEQHLDDWAGWTLPTQVQCLLSFLSLPILQKDEEMFLLKMSVVFLEKMEEKRKKKNTEWTAWTIKCHDQAVPCNWSSGALCYLADDAMSSYHSTITDCFTADQALHLSFKNFIHTCHFFLFEKCWCFDVLNISLLLSGGHFQDQGRVSWPFRKGRGWPQWTRAW